MFQSGCLYKLIWAQILLFVPLWSLGYIHLGDKKIVTLTFNATQAKIGCSGTGILWKTSARRKCSISFPGLWPTGWSSLTQFLHFVYQKKSASAKQVSLHPGLGLIVPHCNILTLICSPYLFVIRKLWRGQYAVGHVEVRSHFRFGQGVVHDQERGLKTRPWLLVDGDSQTWPNYFSLGFFVPKPCAYYCVLLTDGMARIFLDEFS